jgi:hypothetical protein
MLCYIPRQVGLKSEEILLNKNISIMKISLLHQEIQDLIHSKNRMTLSDWKLNLEVIIEKVLLYKDSTSVDEELIELSKYELLLEFLKSKY